MLNQNGHIEFRKHTLGNGFVMLDGDERQWNYRKLIPKFRYKLDKTLNKYIPAGDTFWEHFFAEYGTEIMYAYHPQDKVQSEGVVYDRDDDEGTLGIGDHLSIPRRFYSHHGLYAGSGWVIHYAGLGADPERPKYKAGVRCIRLSDFSFGQKVFRQNYRREFMIFSRDEVYQRALSRIGEDNYCLRSSNCEHFVNWCITGHAKSFQMERANRMAEAAACP